MKKLFNLFLMLFALTATSVVFTACDKEDEPQQQQQSQSPIVGTWKEYNQEGYWELTFTAEGRFIDTLFSEKEGTPYRWTGTYTYANNILTLYYDDGDSWSDTATISGNTLYFDGSALTRQ